jgi:NTE family protein
MTQRADLVLEGGGVKGIALAGAISILQEAGYSFPKVAGTSAGAIVGALVASGVGAEELRDLLESLDYRKFQDEGLIDRFGPLGKAASLLFERGLYEGAYLQQWMGEQLGARGVRTFADLRGDDPGTSLAPERDFRLVVMTSDISAGALRRLPWHAEALWGVEPGSVTVADAVRASMSLPFFYEPVKATHAVTKQESWLVDGGMLSNFPIDVFDRPTGEQPRWPTFGIKLSARPGALQGPKYDASNIVGFARALVGTMTSFHDQMHLDDPSVLARTIFVDTFGVRTTDFDLDRDTARRLFESGRSAAARFLDGWDFERYKREFRSG